MYCVPGCQVYYVNWGLFSRLWCADGEGNEGGMGGEVGGGGKTRRAKVEKEGERKKVRSPWRKKAHKKS